MKKFFLCLLMISMFLNPAIANTLDRVKSINGEYVDGEVLVLMDAPAPSDYSIRGTFNENAYSRAISNQAEDFIKSFGFEACQTFPEIANVSGKSIIHVRATNKSTIQLMRDISSAPNIIGVQPNYIETLNLTPNDFSQLWGMTNIRAPQAWDYTTGSNAVYVAVFDTGIDYNHEDINANMGRDSFGNYGRHFYWSCQ